MYRMAGQWTDVCHTGHAGQDGGSQHRADRVIPAPVLSQTGAELPLDSVVRLFTYLLTGAGGDGLIYQMHQHWPGPGLDGLNPHGDQ